MALAASLPIWIQCRPHGSLARLACGRQRRKASKCRRTSLYFDRRCGRSTCVFGHDSQVRLVQLMISNSPERAGWKAASRSRPGSRTGVGWPAAPGAGGRRHRSVGRGISADRCASPAAPGAGDPGRRLRAGHPQDHLRPEGRRSAGAASVVESTRLQPRAHVRTRDRFAFDNARPRSSRSGTHCATSLLDGSVPGTMGPA